MVHPPGVSRSQLRGHFNESHGDYPRDQGSAITVKTQAVINSKHADISSSPRQTSGFLQQFVPIGRVKQPIGQLFQPIDV
jgi:hypothetical protein